MTQVHDTEVEPDSLPAREDWMALLAEDSSYFRPRLFSIYGVHHAVNDFLPEAPFIGWGMDFGDDNGAWLIEDQSRCVHSADNAERILSGYQRRGEATLRWLD